MSKTQPSVLVQMAPYIFMSGFTKLGSCYAYFLASYLFYLGRYFGELIYQERCNYLLILEVHKVLL